jgi:excisionase family DNA binding protein
MAPTAHAPHADSGKTDIGKKLYRIPEAMRLLSLSRSVIYNQLRSGRLRSVKEGSTRLIPADAIAEYVALLEEEAEADR